MLTLALQMMVPWGEFIERFLELLRQFNYPPNDVLPAHVTHPMLEAASTWQLKEFSTRSVANATLVRGELERRDRYAHRRYPSLHALVRRH